MALKDELQSEVTSIFSAQWTTRDGKVVPVPTDLRLGNDAVKLYGTVLYAELSGSTNMVENYSPAVSAEVYKTFLHCAGKIIRSKGGIITAYDGDRIMAVFIEGNKNTNAVKAALHINWAKQFIVQPAFEKQYPNAVLKIGHTVGIDTSQLMVARIGVRRDNDLVWVGRAANWAAKLTDLTPDYPTRITKAVYDGMLEEAKTAKDGRSMWESRVWTAMQNHLIYRSNWRWSL